jgi:hypothetical protein
VRIRLASASLPGAALMPRPAFGPRALDEKLGRKGPADPEAQIAAAVAGGEPVTARGAEDDWIIIIGTAADDTATAVRGISAWRAVLGRAPL